MKRIRFKATAVGTAIMLMTINAGATVSMLNASKAAEKYADSTIAYQISKLNSESAIIGANSDLSAVKTIEDNIQGYERSLDVLENSLIGADSEKYEETINSIYQTKLAVFNAKRQLAVYKNKVRENELCEEYSERNLNEKKLETAFGIYTQLLDIETKNAAKDYYLKLIDELETTLRIEKSKVELGYSMQIEADKIGAQLSAAKAEYEYYSRYADEARAYLNKLGDENIAESYDFSYILHNENSYRNRFAETDYLSEYKKKQIDNTREYIKDLKRLVEEIMLYIQSEGKCQITEALMDLSDEISSDIKLAENNAEQADLDLKLYGIQREHYIQQSLDNAEIGEMRLRAKDEEILAAEEELRINTILLESGRIKEVDLMHTETELARLKAERQSEETNICKVYFLLENGLQISSE